MTLQQTLNFPIGIISIFVMVITITILFSLTPRVLYGETPPASADAYKKLAISHVKDGMIDDAVKEFEKAVEISYNEGYEKGKSEAERQKNTKIYAKYVILSIVAGLYFAAVFIAILWWSEISSQVSSFRRMLRIKGFVGGIKVRLNPVLRNRAIEIACSEEKLRKAINQESSSGLGEIASSILPRLDELVRQAMLLLELQQNLSEYIKDMNPSKLESEQYDCEEKLKTETDKETKSALVYHLKQIKNKRENHAKAQARIRTCDAVLKGISARIDATSLDLLSLPSVLIKKQEFFERVSVELDGEIDITKNATESVMEESI
jgi:hypothetical protein